jgi:AraC family transcriptional regulator of adaptative response/methylated-DNA-[protein]-cysteine methyltransferase
MSHLDPSPDFASADLASAGLAQRAADYARMDAALAWLAEHWRERPSLDQAAEAVGLSPHHFQRVFTRWAGVSPRTFVAALAHAEASARLNQGDSVLDTALEVGLSGPSRLHDLFVAQEGVTPGQARRRGEGLTLGWGHAPTPFGRGVFVATPRGLCGLGFVAAESDGGLEDMHRRWPAADWRQDDAVAADHARRIFGQGETPPLELIGPPFHVQVWKALLRIPEGRTATYGQLAVAAGKPGACRAPRAAGGANPISGLIPCHRAIGADGRLTGYHWGVARKAAMLGTEAVRRYGRELHPAA